MKKEKLTGFEEKYSFKKFRLKVHFCCGVIVPTSTKGIKGATQNPLIPFMHP